jgi:hypothetical protein
VKTVSHIISKYSKSDTVHYSGGARIQAAAGREQSGDAPKREAVPEDCPACFLRITLEPGFDCRIANNPGMMSSIVPAHVSRRQIRFLEFLGKGTLKICLR